MKRFYHISALLLCCLCCSLVSVAQQESLRDRLAKKQQQQQGTSVNKGTAAPKLSVRAEMSNRNQTRDLSTATWIREVYRELNLSEGSNGALLFPKQPVGNQMNLFTMIFKLMADGNLVGYKWNDGQEMFTPELVEDFGEVLNRLEIPFQQNGNAYIIDEYNILSNEVLGYYLKEAWYFDQANSVMGVKIVALCPVLSRQEYFDDEGAGASTSYREPLFWIPYEDIRPFATRMPIMASDMNNVMNKTIDDYFQMRLYDGEIYKTTNMAGTYLNQKFKTPEEMKYAQDSIESQLKRFDDNLWVINDSIKELFREDVKNKNKKKSNNKASKPKSPKGSSSQAAYSARDRRQ